MDLFEGITFTKLLFFISAEALGPFIFNCEHCPLKFLCLEELQCHMDYHHDSDYDPSPSPAKRRKPVAKKLYMDDIPKVDPKKTLPELEPEPKRRRTRTSPAATTVPKEEPPSKKPGKSDKAVKGVKTPLQPKAQPKEKGSSKDIDPVVVLNQLNKHYFCEIADCKFVGYNTFAELVDHMKTHNNVNHFCCVECTEMYLDIDEFEDHNAKMHPDFDLQGGEGEGEDDGLPEKKKGENSKRKACTCVL